MEEEAPDKMELEESDAATDRLLAMLHEDVAPLPPLPPPRLLALEYKPQPSFFNDTPLLPRLLSPIIHLPTPPFVGDVRGSSEASATVVSSSTIASGVVKRGLDSDGTAPVPNKVPRQHVVPIDPVGWQSHRRRPLEDANSPAAKRVHLDFEATSAVASATLAIATPTVRWGGSFVSLAWDPPPFPTVDRRG